MLLSLNFMLLERTWIGVDTHLMSDGLGTLPEEKSAATGGNLSNRNSTSVRMSQAVLQ